jgi:hypothetical protein
MVAGRVTGSRLPKALWRTARPKCPKATEVIGTTGQFRPGRGLGKAETPVSSAPEAAYLTQTTAGVDHLGSIAGKTTPNPLTTQNWRKKVTSGIGLPALHHPGKMLDMVASFARFAPLTSEPSLLEQRTIPTFGLVSTLTISNIDNRR